MVRRFGNGKGLLLQAFSIIPLRVPAALRYCFPARVK